MASVWKPLFIVAGFLLLLTYLLFQSKSPDLGRRARMQTSLQKLQLLETELTRDLLLLRAGLLPHYDSLPRIGRQLRKTIADLERESASVSDAAGAEMRRRTHLMTAEWNRKLALIEYFKSDNAVLQNSLRYFTHIGQNPGIKASTAVRGEVTALSHAMLRFLQTPEPAAGKHAEAVLDRLAHARGAQPSIEALVAHGSVILRTLPRMDALLHEITADPIARHADSLQDAVMDHASRVEARAQVFRALLYASSVVLLGYLLYQFLRLRARGHELRLTNAELERQIAEREQAATALRASEERFRAITESANDAIISADTSGRIVSWNTRAEEIFGYKAAEILDSPLARLMPARYHPAHQQPFREWADRGFSRLIGRTTEFTAVRRDGSEFPMEISLSSWSTAQGSYVTGIIRDLTAQKQLQEITRQQELQLIQANKMTTLGTLVSGVAHEIKNPNQAILMNAKVVASAWQDVAAVLDTRERQHGSFSIGDLPYAEMCNTIAELLADVCDAARRIDRIVDDLKHFARPRRVELASTFQLNDAVQRGLRLLAHLLAARTDRLEVDLAPELPPIPGDSQHIEQVVVNLLTNAAEALPDRSRGISLKTDFAEDEHGVMLEVRDEGVGIPREHLTRLCDPFFTTKQESGGSGLGLAITSSLVRLHGGRLAFASEPGKWTHARVVLPLAAANELEPSGICATQGETPHE